MPLITLTTDFGEADGYVGTMKGVILSIAPQAQIVDISHDIEPQNVRRAAYIVSTAAPFFPPGTVHVVVVDPGVGSARRHIAVRTQRAFYVGPDNGVLSCPLLQGDRGWSDAASAEPESAQQAPPCRGESETQRDGSPESSRGWRESGVDVVHLDKPAYWLPRVSLTFHGRDIFSPVGAHLVAGVPFEALGTPISDPVTLTLFRPERLADGSIRGQVLHADRFGNLITDIPMSWLSAADTWQFDIADQTITGPSETYAVVRKGDLLALGGSEGLVEIAVREGSAAQTLGVRPGAMVIAVPGARVGDGGGAAPGSSGPRRRRVSG